jgi:hypothetical protein
MAHHLQLAKFLENFSDLEKSFHENLENSGDINIAREQFQTLTRLVSENAPNIPGYELRKIQAAISKLQSKIIQAEESSRPQRKFKFSNRKAKEETSSTILKETEQLPSSSNFVDTKIPEKVSTATLSNLNNQIITLDAAAASSSQDLWLDNINNCTIIIKGLPSTLHMTNLTGCSIIGGPILTSIFVDSCSRSKFVFGCQQLRAHKSNECDFYLHVRGRAIIEDCSECRFAPYNRNYSDKDNDFSLAELDLSTNNWSVVDDFNWLSTETPSPNWSILPENERIQQWSF